MPCTETLIHVAEYLQRNDLQVPVDITARLLERGVDVQLITKDKPR